MPKTKSPAPLAPTKHIVAYDNFGVRRGGGVPPPPLWGRVPTRIGPRDVCGPKTAHANKLLVRDLRYYGDEQQSMRLFDEAAGCAWTWWDASGWRAGWKHVPVWDPKLNCCNLGSWCRQSNFHTFVRSQSLPAHPPHTPSPFPCIVSSPPCIKPLYMTPCGPLLAPLACSTDVKRSKNVCRSVKPCECCADVTSSVCFSMTPS